jgi:hypothetical protein
MFLSIISMRKPNGEGPALSSSFWNNRNLAALCFMLAIRATTARETHADRVTHLCWKVKGLTSTWRGCETVMRPRPLPLRRSKVAATSRIREREFVAHSALPPRSPPLPSSPFCIIITVPLRFLYSNDATFSSPTSGSWWWSIFTSLHKLLTILRSFKKKKSSFSSSSSSLNSKQQHFIHNHKQPASFSRPLYYFAELRLRLQKTKSRQNPLKKGGKKKNRINPNKTR